MITIRNTDTGRMMTVIRVMSGEMESIIRSGFYDLAFAYQSVHVNY